MDFFPPAGSSLTDLPHKPPPLSPARGPPQSDLEAIGNANHQLRYPFYTAAVGAPGPQVIGVTFHDAWTNRVELNPADLESLLERAYGGPAAAPMAERFWGTIEAIDNMILLPVR